MRRSLKYIQAYPSPDQIYNGLLKSPGYPYKTDREFYVKRDRALVSLTYLIAGRISEVLRLTKDQFEIRIDRVIVSRIKLSKAYRTNKKTGIKKPRKVLFRTEAWLPLTGERQGLTKLVLDYLYLLEDLDPGQEIFNIGRKRAYQIVIALTGNPIHWLRAYGENYLYDIWDKDILAVSDYIKIDPATLKEYIRKGYAKYKPG